MRHWRAAGWCSLIGALPLAAQQAPLARAERALEAVRHWDDRLRLAESLGTDTTPDGLPVSPARDSLAFHRQRLRSALGAVRVGRLDSADARAHTILVAAAQGGLAAPPDSADATPDHCTEPGAAAEGAPVSLPSLTAITIACYGAAASAIVVDDDTLNRLAILGLLPRTTDPARRSRLFLALAPVWRSVNGDDGPGSRYRTLLRLRRAAWGDSASPVDRKGPAIGLPAEALESWLIAALELWRRAGPDSLLEPWDWYYLNGEASRRLSPRVAAVADLQRVNRAFYAALGADPERLGVHYDLLPRPGKYPVAFTDFGDHPSHDATGAARPAEPWVFTSYLEGGIDNLAELLHETGHAVHLAAIRTRPAYADWPDNDTYTEALADLAALQLYEPAWQQQFLGDSAPLGASLRAKYAGVVLDLAWALFELRVHREPEADPNRVWAEITSTYLNIRPHPEWSWWAMRGQLVDSPGYLINYALGAFMVADLRARIIALRGDGAWSDPGLYAFLGERLYRFGLERPARLVLEGFLGRALSDAALLQDLGRLQP